MSEPHTVTITGSYNNANVVLTSANASIFDGADSSENMLQVNSQFQDVSNSLSLKMATASFNTEKALLETKISEAVNGVVKPFAEIDLSGVLDANMPLDASGNLTVRSAKLFGNKYPAKVCRTQAGLDVCLMSLEGEGLICLDLSNNSVKWFKSQRKVDVSGGNDPTCLVTMAVLQPWVDKIAADSAVNPYNLFNMFNDFAPYTGPELVNCRNTPVVDYENNEVYVVAGGFYGPHTIVGFDLDTGARKHEFDPHGPALASSMCFGNNFNPYNMVSNLAKANRAGLLLDHDQSGNTCLYYGTTIVSDYVLNNMMGKTDRQSVGEFGQSGSFNKIRVDGSNSYTELWSYNTQPDEILGTSGEQIPAECFRVGETELILQVKAHAGLSFDNNSTVHPHRDSEFNNRTLVHVPSDKDASGNFDQSEKWWIDFPTTGSLDLATSYSALKEVDGALSAVAATFLGAQIVGDASWDPSFSALVTIPTVVKNTYVFDGTETASSIAYSSNSYGGSVWQQLNDSFTSGPSGEFVSFSVGNATKLSDDENYLLKKNTVTLQDAYTKYSNGEWTLQQMKENVIAGQLPVALGPRSNRSCHDSMITLNKVTGELHNINKTIHADAWDLAVIGGFSDIYGQPNNKPYLFPYGPDGDACAPVAMIDNNLGMATKAGYVIIDKPAGPSRVTKSVAGDNGNMGSGIELTHSTTEKKLCVGFGGILGGVNYGLSTDKRRLYVQCANTITWPSVYAALTGEMKGWVSQDGTEFPIGMSYTTCVNLDGTVEWEMPNHRPSSSGYATVANGMVLSEGMSSNMEKGASIIALDKLTGRPVKEFVTSDGDVQPEIDEDVDEMMPVKTTGPTPYGTTKMLNVYPAMDKVYLYDLQRAPMMMSM